nr:substrate-binding domain-containing protein [Fredinandcohnia onubensis]
MRKKIIVLLVLSLLVLLISGCGSANQGVNNNQGSSEDTENKVDTSVKLTSDLTIPDVVSAPDVITTKGPDGETATWYDALRLTPDEVQKVRSMKLRAAFEAPTESEWGNANLRGYKAGAEMLGIELAGTAYAELDPSRQKENMESFMALGVDMIDSQPQEIGLAAKTYDPLVEKGIDLTFLSNVPEGYTPGKEYVGALTDSLYDMGVDAADLLAEAIGGEGEILTITVSSVNYVSNTRDNAFKETIEKKYPKIKIVDNGGFELVKDAGNVANGLLTRYPNVKGVYVSFSTPAIEVLEVLRSLGKKDVKVTTMDLDTICTLDMVNDGNIYGIVADLPFAMGYGRAMLGAYGALGKEAPKYITSPSFKITKENVEEGWKMSFGEELPEDIKKALKK